jgi:hypothetical protein
MTQRGHGAAIGPYIELSTAVNRRERHTTTRWTQTKDSQSADHVSGADFPAFIAVDDKGYDFFKDLNLG